MKSWRTWWGRREADSPVELRDLFIYFGQKTIEELKSEDFILLPVHGFVSQKLFIHLISPSTPSANKCKQIHNTTGVFYCCHPPWQNHFLFVFVCVLHQVRTSSCHVWGSVLHFLTGNGGVRQERVKMLAIQKSLKWAKMKPCKLRRAGGGGWCDNCNDFIWAEFIEQVRKRLPEQLPFMLYWDYPGT